MPKKFLIDTAGRTNKTCRQESLNNIGHPNEKPIGTLNDKNLTLALDKLMSDFDKKNRY